MRQVINIPAPQFFIVAEPIPQVFRGNVPVVEATIRSAVVRLEALALLEGGERHDRGAMDQVQKGRDGAPQAWCGVLIRCDGAVDTVENGRIHALRAQPPAVLSGHPNAAGTDINGEGSNR